MHTTVYLIATFGALIAVGLAGEITGSRALVCGRHRDDTFAAKLVLTVGMYVAVSWVVGILLAHLLNIRFTGGW